MSTARPKALDSYLREISRLGLLSDADETALARRAHAGDEDAVQELTARNLRFVVSVAKRFQHRGLSLEDLIGEGNLGLIAAARRFDPDEGVRFITYAVWWVRQAIAHAIVRQTHQVRLPANRVTALARMTRAAATMHGELGRDPTPAELAGRTGLSEATIGVLQSARRTEISIDAPTHGASDRSLADELADEDHSSIDDATTRGAVIGTVNTAIADLNPREALVLRLHFGLDGEREHTLDEVGERLGVTRERVRQLRDRALSRLRKGKRGAELASLR